ncbi:MULTISPECIES: hypothetical protein [Actinomadura]|uniref:Uncharacterized protein n=1 Tax=Actinomadura algeriensis TaxID=1679523 RepID=A0ABR9JJF9_9ACTN|nr:MULTISPECIES: hypothetical protein [Actinomadura]MBE1530677.1 hypothetical protein [Actinomadura algeriensis]
MIRAVNRLGDRMLGKILPGKTASADACWWTRTGIHCCIYAGITTCH